MQIISEKNNNPARATVSRAIEKFQEGWRDPPDRYM